jgi:hypothetical protein
VGKKCSFPPDQINWAILWAILKANKLVPRATSTTKPATTCFNIAPIDEIKTSYQIEHAMTLQSNMGLAHGLNLLIQNLVSHLVSFCWKKIGCIWMTWQLLKRRNENVMRRRRLVVSG